MPLSEHEQRILAEIERRLLEEDPKFAQQVSVTFKAHLARRMKFAVLGFVVGLAVVLLGIAAVGNAVVSFLGFAVMVGSILLFFQSMRRRAVAERSPQLPVAAVRQRQDRRAAGGLDGWWNRLNERWRQRWEERGGPPPGDRER